jgi:hypothetical protein
MTATTPANDDRPAGNEADADEEAISNHEGLLGAGGAVDRDALFALYEKQAAVDDEAPIAVTFRLYRDLDKRIDKYLVDRVPFSRARRSSD